MSTGNKYLGLASLAVSIDTPSSNVIHTGLSRFSGWCFHPDLDVLELVLNVGGHSVVCNYGHERQDVANAHPHCVGARKSGFEAFLTLDPGSYPLSFSALLSNGDAISIDLSRKISVKPPSLLFVFKNRLARFLSFIRFAKSKTHEWKAARGRLPHLSEIPGLVLKTAHIFKNQRTSEGGLMPPSGFSLPEKADIYDSWLRCNQWNHTRKKELDARLLLLSRNPLISVVMPVFNPPFEFLEKAIDSVLAQMYQNWELCIADDCSTDPQVRQYLETASKRDSRIKLIYLKKNGNISVSTNAAVSIASGEYYAFLDNDDELTPDALAEVALYLARNAQTDYLYSDDDKIDAMGKRFAPQFKPDWSPELLLSYMYCSHLVVVSRDAFHQVGGMRVGFEGSQDYDFALRVTELARHVGHIPRVLYHWRVLPGSTAQSGDAKPASIKAGLRAVEDAMFRRAISCSVKQPGWASKGGLGIFSLDFPDSGPLVTIIIPTKNSYEVLKKCIDSLRLTAYENYEVLIVDNETDDAKTLNYMASCGHRVTHIPNPVGGFNYAHINNIAASQASGDFVLFLNNDTQVNEPKWLSRMVGYAGMPRVGVVGARLLYPDGRVQHAGIVHGYYKGMTGPANKLLPSWHNGYLSYAAVARNYLAVTAACLLVRRDLFIDQGGFDEINFGVAYNDVDLCYRLVHAGYRCVYSAGSELFHYEGLSRGYSDKPAEEAAFKRKYDTLIDPYYNCNLSLENERFEIAAVASSSARPTKPIRTLMVAFNLNLEGAPYSQYELTVGLKRRGVVDPIVYCPDDGPLRALYETEGITVLVMTHPLRGVFDLDGYEKSIAAFVDFVQAQEVDLVYANTLQTFYAIEAAYRASLPSIWNPRESEPWQTYFCHFGNEIAARALRCFSYPYKVIFVSDATLNGCSVLNSQNNFTTVYNGLDPVRAAQEKSKYTKISSREKLEIEENERVLLLLGTVCERKGQADLLGALREIDKDFRCENLRCFIVGDRVNAYNIRLHQEWSLLSPNLRARVHIIPETNDTALYLSAADIFLCSSRVESYPRVILEAMYYGLAIISTPVFGISEQLNDKINALFYQPGDVELLAAHIECLIKDQDMLRKLSINAKYRFDRLTSFDEMLKQYSEAFIGAYFTRSR